MRSSTVMLRPANLLKSSSSTFCEFVGIGSEGLSTASATDECTAVLAGVAIMEKLDSV